MLRIIDIIANCSLTLKGGYAVVGIILMISGTAHILARLFGKG